MDIRTRIKATTSILPLLAILSITSLCGQSRADLPIEQRTEAEQISWIKSYLAQGMPPGDDITMLALNKSSITLPILEQEIEAIYHSTDPKQLFISASVDPQRVVNGALGAIEYAGDAQSLRAASKLLKLDPTRFDNVVEGSMGHAFALRNPFIVAYQGLEIGDPEVDKRIVKWLDWRLTAGADYDHVSGMQSWAAAMVEKYNGVPTGSQLTYDPILSRLDLSKYKDLPSEMLRLSAEAARKRAKP